MKTGLRLFVFIFAFGGVGFAWALVLCLHIEAAAPEFAPPRMFGIVRIARDCRERLAVRTLIGPFTELDVGINGHISAARTE